MQETIQPKGELSQLDLYMKVEEVLPPRSSSQKRGRDEEDEEDPKDLKRKRNCSQRGRVEKALGSIETHFVPVSSAKHHTQHKERGLTSFPNPTQETDEREERQKLFLSGENCVIDRQALERDFSSQKILGGYCLNVFLSMWKIHEDHRNFPKVPGVITLIRNACGNV